MRGLSSTSRVFKDCYVFPAKPVIGEIKIFGRMMSKDMIGWLGWQRKWSKVTASTDALCLLWMLCDVPLL